VWRILGFPVRTTEQKENPAVDVGTHASKPYGPAMGPFSFETAHKLTHDKCRTGPLAWPLPTRN
jgi:hypothetical protein